jgi:hypothetical protein
MYFPKCSIAILNPTGIVIIYNTFHRKQSAIPKIFFLMIPNNLKRPFLILSSN